MSFVETKPMTAVYWKQVVAMLPKPVGTARTISVIRRHSTDSFPASAPSKYDGHERWFILGRESAVEGHLQPNNLSTCCGCAKDMYRRLPVRLLWYMSIAIPPDVICLKANSYAACSLHVRHNWT